jgi:UDP-N-acetylglucosamine:LPS N-acetylglucosamine transferase
MLEPKTSARRPRVMAVASPGGHWVQLQRLRPAWDGCDVVYVTTDPDSRAQILQDAAARGQPVPAFHAVTDASMWQKLRLVRQMIEVALLVLRYRPTAIISTGAAPGYFALRAGRLIGARTIWVDSIANAEELSLAGSKAGPHADLWLTQWPDLARPGGPNYAGSVI